jgi:DNA repair protein RadC
MDVKGLSPENPPCEKLLEHGAESLGVNELLAVLLGCGSRSLSMLELANRLLVFSGGLVGLSQSSAEALASLHGVKQA